MGAVESLQSSSTYHNIRLLNGRGTPSSAAAYGRGARPELSDKLKSATVCFADAAGADGCGIRENKDPPDYGQLQPSPHARRSWKAWARDRGRGEVRPASLQSESLPHLPSHIERLRRGLVAECPRAGAMPSDAPPQAETPPASASAESDATSRPPSSGLLGLHHRLSRHLSRSGARLGRRRHRRKGCDAADPGPTSTASADSSPELLAAAGPLPDDSRPLARQHSLPDLQSAAVHELPSFQDSDGSGGGGGQQFSEELSRELAWLALGSAESAPVHVTFYASSEHLADASSAGSHPVPAQSTEPSIASLVSGASSLTLAEMCPDAFPKCSPAVAASCLGDATDAVDYEGLIYLTAHTTVSDMDGIACGAPPTDENTMPAPRPITAAMLGFGEDLDDEVGIRSGSVRRWWPRCILPAHNMQYMPKLSTLIEDAASRSSSPDGAAVGLCDECIEGGSAPVDGPVDEAMAAATPGCGTPGCPNYVYTLARKARRVHDGWLGGLGGHSLCQHSDYWDILSRCPMRPTSSLALASLRDMVRACTAGSSTGRCACMERTDAYAALSKSTDSESSNDGMCLAASSSYLALRRHSLRTTATASVSSRGSQSCKQKRTLSEPMQYILYNSYIRYYGQPCTNS
ncbi:hypothetical protein H4R19_000664 [Coemansia spiralis]|nr:hypothetical protein H4R19_000664 [Coemansia spiralis]